MARGCLSVFLLCAVGCASGKTASRGASGSATERRAAELESRNEELRAELSRKQAELRQSFQVTAQAESAAGLNNLGCVGVAPARAQVQGLPRSGAVHSQFMLRGQPYRMTATFSSPRTVGEWRSSQGTCKVTP
ncbi:hypothetical protein MEBOL_000977 [Melittangium boletus DSM 14713]|uniref:Uncharacterized protein n=2 Tax=Melittangium boletus TaxID=83453 RepID=A0A250I6Q1_9BACT|nr:hypothetical protein MEBOL_000977 [Melittangium boletus DSM 14713]